jgi:hypothetical protein
MDAETRAKLSQSKFIIAKLNKNSTKPKGKHGSAISRSGARPRMLSGALAKQDAGMDRSGVKQEGSGRMGRMGGGSGGGGGGSGGRKGVGALLQDEEMVMWVGDMADEGAKKMQCHTCRQYCFLR